MTEEELNEKTHIEALFSEWEFQNAEGIYTFDRDVMFKHCFEDAYKLGKKELEAENDDIYDALNTQSLRTSELEAQIEKMKCDVLSLIKDRMNDDIDQNLIERMADKWGLKYE